MIVGDHLFLSNSKELVPLPDETFISLIIAGSYYIYMLFAIPALFLSNIL